ncbi:hypothetical protein TeGR_g5449, partial [Tetraparma gracilis]
MQISSSTRNLSLNVAIVLFFVFVIGLQFGMHSHFTDLPSTPQSQQVWQNDLMQQMQNQHLDSAEASMSRHEDGPAEQPPVPT